MKIKNILLASVTCILALGFTSCKDDNDTVIGPDFSGTYQQADQMARPAINTVFVNEGDKDIFNTTPPVAQGAAFQTKFEAKLMALNPGYTTNALNWDATTFTSALATDVLNVSLDGATAFGSLTGRALDDDVIDTELILIFGGPMGTDNPTLISDNVGGNDKPFLAAFPYVASPW